MVGTIATGLVTWVVALLVGMQPLPGTVPFFNLVHDRPLAVLGVGTTVLAITVAAWWIAHRPVAGSGKPAPGRARHHQRGSSPALVAMAGLSTVSTSMSIALIALVLLQPSWCPSALCPQPPGPHDQFLESEFTALQTTAYVVRGDPATFSLRDLPDGRLATAAAAQRITGSTPRGADVPYRVAIRVHSLQRGQFGMVIEQVALSIVGAGPPPSPLRVVLAAPAVEYQSNPYAAVYEGQAAGAIVPAQYAGPVRVGHVQLAPGESDELSIQVDSRALVDLRFRVRIAYRVVTEGESRTLELPYLFEVVCSDDLNWQPFDFHDGRLVPA